MIKPLLIGISDFRKLRVTNLEYIDKTRFMEQLINDCGSVGE